jgi:hypothetical protein
MQHENTMKPWKAFTPARWPQAADVETLAARYLDHALLMERETPRRTTVDIHVFPVKPSGRGHAADFRRHLAARLTTGRPDPDTPLWVGSRYLHKLSDLREHYENRLAPAGFRFVEVNPADYS